MKSKKAFTLIELLLVIVILSVIVGLSAPNFGKTFKRMELKKTADNIAYLVRWAQARAVNENIDYKLVFLDNFKKFQILRADEHAELGYQESFLPVPVHLGRAFKIPDSVEVDSGVESMNIYPDGSLDKVQIHLKGNGEGLVLSSMEQRGKLFILEDGNEL